MTNSVVLMKLKLNLSSFVFSSNCFFFLTVRETCWVLGRIPQKRATKQSSITSMGFPLVQKPTENDVVKFPTRQMSPRKTQKLSGGSRMFRGASTLEGEVTDTAEFDTVTDEILSCSA